MRVLFNRDFDEEQRLQRALNVRLSHCSEQMRMGLRTLPNSLASVGGTPGKVFKKIEEPYISRLQAHVV